MLTGVCGGIGEYVNIDPTVVRVLYVIGSIVSVAFPGMLVYLILTIVIPQSKVYR